MQERIKVSDNNLEQVDMTIIADKEIRDAYKEIKEKVKLFYEKAELSMKPKIPTSGKKNRIKQLNKLNYINFPISFISEKIPNELFSRYFEASRIDEEITDELRKYRHKLGINDSIINIDMKDITSNPKVTDGSTYIEATETLFNEHGKYDMNWYMKKIEEVWLEKEGEQSLWDSIFSKTGPYIDVINNGSHITNLLKIMRVSGLSDEELRMPKGFVKSLEKVSIRCENTPDDLEFVLMFNRIQEIMEKRNQKVLFYLKDDSEKGVNVLGIEGEKIEISNIKDLVEYVSSKNLEIEDMEL